MKAEIYLLCGTFPTQGYGRFEDGSYFFLHYRHGKLAIYRMLFLNSRDMFANPIEEKPLYSFDVEEGWTSEDLEIQLPKMTAGVISWTNTYMAI